MEDRHVDAEEFQQIDKAKAERHNGEARDKSKLIGWMCVLLFLKKDLTDPPELILLSSAGWLGCWLVAGRRLLNIVPGGCVRLTSRNCTQPKQARQGHNFTPPVSLTLSKDGFDNTLLTHCTHTHVQVFKA